MQKHPKIVIIGAGSLFFGRKLIWSMNRLKGLTNGHLALVDTDPDHLAGMEALAQKVRAESGADHAISAHADFRDALPGADFVILSFSKRNAHYRGVDVQISARHGIRMCSGDTIGPGGVFRALREFDEIHRIVREVERLCPEAWLVNYINPSAVFGMALQKICRTPWFALCDSLHIPHLQKNYLKLIGREEADVRDFRMRIAGVNHFTWLIEADLKGQDVMKEVHEAIRAKGVTEKEDAYAKSLLNARISAQLADVFGAIPVCTAHTKEYLPYWQGYGVHVEEEPAPPLKLFEHEERTRITEQMWQDIEDFTSGRKPVSEFLDKGTSDHATDVIQAIWNDSGEHYYVNVPNNGAVPNLPETALLELECIVNRGGPRPIPAPAMPCGLVSLQHRILETHELTVEGYLRKDPRLLVRALAIDPIVNSLVTAEAVFKDLVEAQKDVLPTWLSDALGSAKGSDVEVIAAGMGTAPGSVDLQLGQTREGW
jgi:alpha-galactosidase/6-phospho-beta-glucosidase family protein